MQIYGASCASQSGQGGDAIQELLAKLDLFFLNRKAEEIGGQRQLLLRIGAAKKKAGRAYRLVQIRLPKEGEAVTRQSFTFALDQDKLRKSELHDGHYLLRSNLVADDPAVLWERYGQLCQIEAAFKSLKSELGLRPIYRQLEHRVEAHILIAVLAYSLLITLKNRLQALAPGLTPRAVLEKLATSDVGCVFPHDRRTLAGDAPLYATRAGPTAAFAPTQAFLAPATIAQAQGPLDGAAHRTTRFVDEDLLTTLAETKGLS